MHIHWLGNMSPCTYIEIEVRSITEKIYFVDAVTTASDGYSLNGIAIIVGYIYGG